MQSHKTKFFYDKIIENVHEPPSSIHYWNDNGPTTLTHDIFKEACKKKIKCIKDPKLAETNFKILHNVLPCNYNLFKWKLNESKFCQICGNTEDIKHLIYECSYAKAIWRKVQNVVEENISLEMILFGFYSRNDVNFMLSIVVYSIYKEWLICSYEKKLRKTEPNFSMYKAAFLYRKRLYEHCRHAEFSNICQLLEKLISCIS